MAGFVVLPFLFGSTRLLAVAGMVLLAAFIAGPFLPPIAVLPTRSWMAQRVAEAAVLIVQAVSMRSWLFASTNCRRSCPCTYSCFRELSPDAFSAAAWRAGLFRTDRRWASRYRWLTCRNPSRCRHVALKRVAWLGMEGGVIGRARRCRTACVRLRRVDHLGLGESASPEACGLGNPDWTVAFTNYLLQSVIFGWIFLATGSAYSVGLVSGGVCHWRHRICLADRAQCLLATAIPLGPVEWVWRSFHVWGTAALSRA